jgi:hypothetical protein
MKKLIFSIATVVVFILSSCGDEISSENDTIKKVAIEALLDDYENCQSFGKDAMDCKDFTAKAICQYFGVNDLQKEGKYIDYHDIYDFVSASNEWENLGSADEQLVLDNAQQFANKGIPVIAIDTEDPHKLTVLIIAGELGSSSKWGGKVPNCAAFFPINGPQPFINKTLNYAWSSPDGIEIWVRN